MLCFDEERFQRLGFEEAVLAEGKTNEDLLTILCEIGTRRPLLITRISQDKVEWCKKEQPQLLDRFTYNARARVLRSKEGVVSMPASDFKVAVIAAGTSDRSVAEEVLEVFKFYDIPYQLFADVGVAGVHRLLKVKDEIAKHHCAVCIAGMDGALASVVAGLFAMPVIGVPTSVGYGSAQSGTAALLSMLNSCANGLCVMNIDNGFGAAMAALRIRNHRLKLS